MKFILAFISTIVLLLGTSSLAFAAEAPGAKAPGDKVATAEIQDTININTANVEELTKLKGIGVKKAEAIIAWRNENGNFKTVDQLLDVKGIGEATLAQNRENIRI